VSTKTDPQVIADLLDLSSRIKKTAVVVGNCPGFAVNRTFFPYTMAAAFLVDRGVDIYHIDRVVKAWGMPMGPFRLGDLVGIDILTYVAEQYHEHFGDRTYRSALFEKLAKSGRLGEKSGKGFYLHDESRKEKQDPELLQFIANARKDTNLPTLSGLSDKDITEMIFLPVLNEATRIIDEGFVQKSSDLDIASVFGMGFPSHLGGPIQWGDQLTAKYVHDRLQYFYQTFGHPLFKPSPFIVARAASNTPLSAPKQAAAPALSDDDIVIVAAARTAIGKAKKGGFNNTPIDDLLKVVMKKVVDDASPIKPSDIGDVVVGTVLGSTAATQARTAMLMAGIPYTVPVRTLNRQCSSGLQAIVDVAAAIKAGLYDIGLACGAESMSTNSMMPKDFKPNPNALKDPVTASCYTPMGITSENVAEKYSVSREVQDRFAAESHARAARANAAGKLNHIVPVTTNMITGEDGKTQQVTVTRDEGVRSETTFESLGKLKPAFKTNGTTTAGNASQTSDGAAATLLTTRRKAKELGLKPLATLRSYHVAGCDPSIMGIGPAIAIPGALQRAGLNVNDIKVYEINEAFASQCTYCLDKLGLNPEKVNPNGGAIAIGHPLGMSGARMTVDIIHELNRQGGGYGVVSMCIGTGMGAAAVFYVDP
jgi:acetyl-CoA acyltransferase 1